MATMNRSVSCHPNTFEENRKILKEIIDKDELVSISPDELGKLFTRLNTPKSNAFSGGKKNKDAARRDTKGESQIYGPIPGIPPGSWWGILMDCSRDEVHVPLNKNVHGGIKGGAVSVCTSHSAEDVDLGDCFTFTVGYKSQEHHRLHESLARKIPVRVVRTYDLSNDFSPKTGCRYDGLYMVVKCWLGSTGQDWSSKFALMRLIHQEPPPWKNTGKPAEVIHSNSLGSPGQPKQVVNDTIISRCISRKLKKNAEKPANAAQHQMESSPERSSSKTGANANMDRNRLTLSRGKDTPADDIRVHESPRITRRISKNLQEHSERPSNNGSCQNESKSASGETDGKESGPTLAKSENTNISLRTNLYDSSHNLQKGGKRLAPVILQRGINTGSIRPTGLKNLVTIDTKSGLIKPFRTKNLEESPASEVLNVIHQPQEREASPPMGSNVATNKSARIRKIHTNETQCLKPKESLLESNSLLQQTEVNTKLDMNQSVIVTKPDTSEETQCLRPKESFSCSTVPSQQTKLATEAKITRNESHSEMLAFLVQKEITGNDSGYNVSSEELTRLYYIEHSYAMRDETASPKYDESRRSRKKHSSDSDTSEDTPIPPVKINSSRRHVASKKRQHPISQRTKQKSQKLLKPERSRELISQDATGKTSQVSIDLEDRTESITGHLEASSSTMSSDESTSKAKTNATVNNRNYLQGEETNYVREPEKDDPNAYASSPKPESKTQGQDPPVTMTRLEQGEKKEVQKLPAKYQTRNLDDFEAFLECSGYSKKVQKEESVSGTVSITNICFDEDFSLRVTSDDDLSNCPSRLGKKESESGTPPVRKISLDEDISVHLTPEKNQPICPRELRKDVADSETVSVTDTSFDEDFSLNLTPGFDQSASSTLRHSPVTQELYNAGYQQQESLKDFNPDRILNIINKETSSPLAKVLISNIIGISTHQEQSEVSTDIVSLSNERLDSSSAAATKASVKKTALENKGLTTSTPAAKASVMKTAPESKELNASTPATKASVKKTALENKELNASTPATKASVKKTALENKGLTTSTPAAKASVMKTAPESKELNTSTPATKASVKKTALENKGLTTSTPGTKASAMKTALENKELNATPATKVSMMKTALENKELNATPATKVSMMKTALENKELNATPATKVSMMKTALENKELNATPATKASVMKTVLNSEELITSTPATKASVKKTVLENREPETSSTPAMKPSSKTTVLENSEFKTGNERLMESKHNEQGTGEDTNETSTNRFKRSRRSACSPLSTRSKTKVIQTNLPTKQKAESPETASLVPLEPFAKQQLASDLMDSDVNSNLSKKRGKPSKIRSDSLNSGTLEDNASEAPIIKVVHSEAVFLHPDESSLSKRATRSNSMHRSDNKPLEEGTDESSENKARSDEVSVKIPENPAANCDEKTIENADNCNRRSVDRTGIGRQSKPVPKPAVVANEKTVSEIGMQRSTRSKDRSTTRMKIPEEEKPALVYHSSSSNDSRDKDPDYISYSSPRKRPTSQKISLERKGLKNSTASKACTLNECNDVPEASIDPSFRRSKRSKIDPKEEQSRKTNDDFEAGGARNSRSTRSKGHPVEPRRRRERNSLDSGSSHYSEEVSKAAKVSEDNCGNRNDTLPVKKRSRDNESAYQTEFLRTLYDDMAKTAAGNKVESTKPISEPSQTDDTGNPMGVKKSPVKVWSPAKIITRSKLRASLQDEGNSNLEVRNMKTSYNNPERVFAKSQDRMELLRKLSGKAQSSDLDKRLSVAARRNLEAAEKTESTLKPARKDDESENDRRRKAMLESELERLRINMKHDPRANVLKRTRERNRNNVNRRWATKRTNEDPVEHPTSPKKRAKLKAGKQPFRDKNLSLTRKSRINRSLDRGSNRTSRNREEPPVGSPRKKRTKETQASLPKAPVLEKNATKIGSAAVKLRRDSLRISETSKPSTNKSLSSRRKSLGIPGGSADETYVRTKKAAQMRKQQRTLPDPKRSQSGYEPELVDAAAKKPRMVDVMTQCRIPDPLESRTLVPSAVSSQDQLAGANSEQPIPSCIDQTAGECFPIFPPIESETVKAEVIDLDDIKSEVLEDLSYEELGNGSGDRLEEETTAGCSNRTYEEVRRSLDYSQAAGGADFLPRNVEKSHESSSKGFVPYTESRSNLRPSNSPSAFVPLTSTKGNLMLHKLRSIGFRPIQPGEDWELDRGCRSSTDTPKIAYSSAVARRGVHEEYERYTSEENNVVRYMDDELRYQDIEDEDREDEETSSRYERIAVCPRVGFTNFRAEGNDPRELEDDKGWNVERSVSCLRLETSAQELTEQEILRTYVIPPMEEDPEEPWHGWRKIISNEQIYWVGW